MVSEYLLRTQQMRARRKIITDNGAGTNVARMAGEERHLQILRVAMSLFSQRGFRGTTTKEIALAAGVSEAMVFRHFATKEELYMTRSVRARPWPTPSPARMTGPSLRQWHWMP